MSKIVGLDGRPVEIPPFDIEALCDEPVADAPAPPAGGEALSDFVPDPGLIRLLEILLEDVKNGVITGVIVAAVGPSGTYDAAAPMAMPFEDFQRLLCQVESARIGHMINMRNAALRIYTNRET